jgi:hypothetical protein
MPLEKSSIPRPVLARETVNVPELGGEVVVQALLLRDRLALSDAERSYALVADMLSRSVVDANGDPIFTAEEWEIFGATGAEHHEAAMSLWDKARAVSGMGGGEKNEQAQS